MENHLGRILNADEIVHHINGNKKDNRLCNLELMNMSDHARYHAVNRGKKMALLKCPYCGNEFTREYRQTHMAKNGRATFCSKSCSGSFGQKEQMQGITEQMADALFRNVVRVYMD